MSNSNEPYQNPQNQNPPSYQPGYAPPPPYSAPPQPPYSGYPYPQPYAGPMAPATSGWAIASLVCAFIIPILGLIFGYIARNEIRNSGGRLTGDGLALAGIIVSWVYIGLGIVGIACAFLPVILSFLFYSVPTN